MTKEEILKILVDWNYWGNYKDESIERTKYLKELEGFVNSKEVLVIKGVRRSGKSTFLLQFVKSFIEKKQISAKDVLVINFEDPRWVKLNLNLLNKIYEIYLEELLPSKNHYVILDEIQEIKGWEKFVRFLSEAKKISVFVTGSSSKLLSEEYATLLSGRHIDLEIYPLCFEEFLLFNDIKIDTKITRIKLRHKIKNLLKKYFEFGGFPKIALVKEKEKKAILENYFRDILIKDVQRRFEIREVEKLEELAKYYLTNISTIQSFNKVKDIIGLSLDSVQRFSKYFSIARLFFFVPKFSFSLKQQILNPKKVYTIDVGLKNIVSFRFSKDKGRIMENIVFLELFKRKYQIFYWKSIEQKEVDFVVKKDLKIKQLIQVCLNLEELQTKKREIEALLSASKKLKCNNLLVITFDYEAEEKIKEKKINFIPLWKWLLEQKL